MSTSFLHLRYVIDYNIIQRSGKIIFLVGEREKAKPFRSFRPQLECFSSLIVAHRRPYGASTADLRLLVFGGDDRAVEGAAQRLC